MAIETYELRIFGVAGVQTQESIIHFTGTGLTANDTFRSGQNLVNGFFTSVLSAWLDCCAQNYSVLKLTARRVSSKPSAEAFASFGPGIWQGSIADDPIGNQLRPSMFLVPTMGTKSGGRIFMPSCPDTQIINNQYQANYVTATGALGTILVAGFTNSPITWQTVVWSRKHLSGSVVTATQMSPVLGYQKRSKKVS